MFKLGTLFSFSFWASLFHSKLRGICGPCARSSIIALFTFFEVCSASCLAFFYYQHDVSELGVLFTPQGSKTGGYVFLAAARGLQGLTGYFAARKRKVRLMRHYVLWLPFSIAYTLALLVPVLRLDCWCSDYRQCDVLSSFAGGRVANLFPPPTSPWQPPPYSPLIDKVLHAWPGGHSHHFPQREPAQRRLDEVSPDHDLIEPSWKRHKKKRSTQVWDPKETMEIVGEPLHAMIRDECTCAGPIYLPETGNPHYNRESCKFWDENAYVDETAEQVDANTPDAQRMLNRKIIHYATANMKPKNWCYIRNASREACLKDKVVAATLKEDPSDVRKHLWTEALCGGRCDAPEACMGVRDRRRQGMRIGDRDLTKENDRERFGNRCKIWTKEDKVPWCFVGFDSACSDRKLYTLSQDDFLTPPLHLSDVSQFYSYLPCNKAIREQAEHLCQSWKVGILSIIGILTILSLVMVPVICLFVGNRCGDMLEVTDEFAVQFSSDSEDDFNVKDNVSGVDAGIIEATTKNYMDRKTTSQASSRSKERRERASEVSVELADLRHTGSSSRSSQSPGHGRHTRQ